MARAVLLSSSIRDGRTMRRETARRHPMAHRRTYAAIAAAVSPAAPAGLVLLESILAGRFPTPHWIALQLGARPEVYAYVFSSSLLALAALGFVLGRKQDWLEAAWTDELTGLASRRLFVARLRQEIGRAARSKTPLSLLLIDVDHLKEINDGAGGHEVGDAALRALAETLRATCRATDLAARFGGDEFAVIAPFAEARQGMELATRIRKSLASIRVESRTAQFPLTVSIGVADLDGAALHTAEALCDAADRALYVAKSRGRDCAALASATAAGDPPDLADQPPSANDSVREASSG
jgi:diguanylate cyclase (GGDEF)-like protein